MNNADVAAVLSEIAEFLELENASPFRIRAYQNAAKAVDALNDPVQSLSASGELQNVRGIGESIAQKIEELLSTGHIQYLEELRQDFPPGVVELMAVPGVGPSLARRVYTELGIEDLKGLEAAARDGRLASLKGLGEKSAENVLRGLQRVNKRDTRISLGVARPLVEDLVAQLSAHDFIHDLTPAGSLRRWKPTIGDIDLMATSGQPERVMEVFVNLDRVRDVLAHGPTKSSIVTDTGLQVDLRIVEAECWGSLVQHFTGSRDHNIQLREYALQRGLSLNEYGIAKVTGGSRETFGDEGSFYAALDLPWIPPELREAQGEIEAAREGRLPDLLGVDDVRGDLHVHSEWSDGSGSVEVMVEAARAHGYDYVAITDHSPSTGVAGGLSSDRLLEQVALVRQLDREIEGIHVLAGSEVDIKRDGTLDFPDEVLSQLDWVIASVHSGFNQTEDQMTARMVRAMENPHVDAVAHPTGGLIGKRAPYAVDLEQLFRAAARTHTALEINAQPMRLDLVDTQARRAVELGVMLVINTDAHAPNQLQHMRYGVAMARRGWATANSVLNARDFAGLKRWLRSGAR